jgi:HD superfamily phosphohydrolase
VNLTPNKKKIFNDPVYGFVNVSEPILFDLIEHPFFQRLRRIRQLGLTDFVYPGAQHTRFHHALGAMHLMSLAIEVLRSKGNEITHEEATAALIAILLHDIGHGPFSHALEHTLVKGIHHEQISLLLMNQLNQEFNGALTLAIKIFKDEYPKKFLHQLVSSQLDVDRLDYLNRDSFYTGVAEGTVGSDRIIHMLQVVNDELVIEEKGIYSIEKFIIARRFMYWQVYLHKTVLSAENLLVNMLRRAKFLSQSKVKLFATSNLDYFLNTGFSGERLLNDKAFIDKFVSLDDYDIFACAKEWTKSDDRIIASLSTRLLERKLLKIKLNNNEFTQVMIESIKEKFMEVNKMNKEDSGYFVFSGVISNSAYKPDEEHIKILMKSGDVVDIHAASDQLRLPVLSQSIKKHFICYPKQLEKYFNQGG